MSTLTSKMKTAREDYIGDSCKIFLPFNEGSGNSVIDLVADLTINDTGTIEYNTSHAATIIASGAVGSGTVPDVASGKSVILMDATVVVGNTIFSVTTIGASSGSRRISMSGSQATISNSSGTGAVTANFGTLTAGQSAFRTMTFNGSTGELRAYSGANGGAVTFQNTADAVANIGALDFANQVAFASGSAQDYYGLAMFVVDSLPSDTDLLSVCNVHYKWWTTGRKWLHSDTKGW